MKRVLADGLELDDDKARIDRSEVHRFLCDESYWAAGRPRETQDRLIDEASRVVGLYDGERQIGFCRAATDGVSFVYLADVYVLEEYRGRGLGEELVREMIESGPFAGCAGCSTRRTCTRSTASSALDAGAKVMERAVVDEPGERERVAVAQAAVATVDELEVQPLLGQPGRQHASRSAAAPRSRKYSSRRPASSQTPRQERTASS